ncbi:ATP-binding protein [Polaromonas sp.]|uniref:sensor histidine kinase n=1 Tax=Polaromonas sp. TaxID=1869339 RepID=UPI0035685526
MSSAMGYSGNVAGVSKVPAALRSIRKILDRRGVDGMQLLVGALALLVSALVSLVVAYSMSSLNRAAVEEMKAENKAVSHAMVQYVSAGLQLVDHTLKQGRSDWVEGSRLSDHREFYQSFPNFKTMIFQVAIIRTDGMLVASSIDPDAKPIFLGEREHFLVHAKASSDSLFVSRPLVGRVSKRTSIQFSRPIFGKDGIFAGVIVASVDPAFFSDYFSSSDQENTVSFGLLGTDGLNRVWSGPLSFNPALLAPPLPPGKLAVAGLYKSFSSANATAQPATSWYVKPLRDFPLSVVVGSDSSKLDLEIGRHNMLALGLVVLFVFGLSAAAIYGIRNLRARGQIVQLLQDSQIKTSSANAMKSRFVADISHELRTPLNGILGFSELICSSIDMKKMHDFGKLINTSAKHLHQLVNTLLDLAKIEAGRMEINRTVCQLHELCESVAAIHRYAAEKKEIILSLDYAADLPDTIYIDRIKLMQILNNVLHNATKFTTQGCIFFHVVRKADYWLFKISDTGIGMSRSRLDRLFDRFSHTNLQDETGSSETGSGLGMALCKELTELLGGRVTVISSEGVGTQFEIFLPMESETVHGSRN